MDSEALYPLQVPEMVTWIDKALAGEHLFSSPSGQNTPDETLLGLYESSKEFLDSSEIKFFRKRFRESLAELVRRWNVQKRSYDYLGYLISLVGFTHASEAAEPILALAEEANLKGIRGDQEDLHLRILSILCIESFIEKLGKDRLRKLFDRDWEEKRYEEICGDMLPELET